MIPGCGICCLCTIHDPGGRPEVDSGTGGAMKMSRLFLLPVLTRAQLRQFEGSF